MFGADKSRKLLLKPLCYFAHAQPARSNNLLDSLFFFQAKVYIRQGNTPIHG
jgi:hypothetical protein